MRSSFSCRYRGGRQHPNDDEDFVLLLGTEEFVLHVVVDTEEDNELLNVVEEDELLDADEVLLDSSSVLTRRANPPSKLRICPPRRRGQGERVDVEVELLVEFVALIDAEEFVLLVDPKEEGNILMTRRFFSPPRH